MNKLDFTILIITIFIFLGSLLSLNISYEELVYKYNEELSKNLKLLNKNKKLLTEEKVLSSPHRIINYSIKYLGLELPKANKVITIEKD